jgi:predicted dehydrogenase
MSKDRIQVNRMFNNKTMKTLNAVVLGVGGQGFRRAQAIRLSKGWKLVGVYDFDTDRARDTARRLGCASLPDERTAIEGVDADFIVIATPPHAHDGQIEAALNASRHVLCEKPLTIRAEAARRLEFEARKQGLVLATGFNHRFYRPVEDVLGCIRANRFGSLRHIEAFIGHPPDDSALKGWHGDPARSGGGVLIDNGSHLIDLIRLFLGEVDRLSLEHLRFHERCPGIDTRVRFRCENDSGVTAHAECSWEHSGRSYLTMEFAFENGSARLSAFPWRSEFVEYGKSGRSNGHWRERVVAKALGLRAPGLEMSLIRELSAIRSAVLNEPTERSLVPCALAHDGARAATIVESLGAQAEYAAEKSLDSERNSVLWNRCA